MEKIIKKCKCGREYTEEEWGELSLIGLQRDWKGNVYELRNCLCNSTLAVLKETLTSHHNKLNIKEDEG